MDSTDDRVGILRCKLVGIDNTRLKLWRIPVEKLTLWLADDRIGYGCQFLKNDGQWRIPLAIQIVPAVFLFG